MIPCKEIKCLLLAACQNKTHIDCPYIQEYYKQLRKDHNRVSAYKILKWTFKNMSSFKPTRNSTMHESKTGDNQMRYISFTDDELPLQELIPMETI